MAVKEGFDEQHRETPVPACRPQAKLPLEQGERCLCRCRGSAAGASMLRLSLEKGGRREEGREDGLSPSARRLATCLLLVSAQTNEE